MAKAKDGDTVKVHYTGKFGDGKVFDSSVERDEPLEVKLGTNQVIPGFEKALLEMEVGEKKNIDFTADEGYGPRREELVANIEREKLPEDIDPVVGQFLQIDRGDGQPLVAEITHVADDTITLDANHPLAGKDLSFEIELVEIV